MSRKHPKVTDDELLGIIKSEAGHEDSDSDSLLSQQRKDSVICYQGGISPGLGASTGGSSTIFNLTQPAVDTLATYMTKIFCSDDDTVMFVPSDSKLAPIAKMVTRVINDIIHKDNNGYEIMNRWFKDAGINKNGIVKAFWDDTPISHKETYTGTGEEIKSWMQEQESAGFTVDILSRETETKVLTAESDTEILEVSENKTTYTCKLSKEGGKVQYLNVPPEEFIINGNARGINNDTYTRFVGHRQILHLSDVMLAFPKADAEGLLRSNADDLNGEADNRGILDGTDDILDNSVQDTLAQIEVMECWIRADRDGDGFAEWRHCFVSGSELLLDEEWFITIPFGSFTYFPEPHKFFGKSVYDRLKGYQLAKTALGRSGVDTSVRKNTFQGIFNPRSLNKRDINSGRPGWHPSKTTFNANEDVFVLPSHQGAGGSDLAFMSYIDKEVIAQIGIDVGTGMVSADIEKSGNDAEKTSMTIDNSSTKIEGYCREFAETGLADIVFVTLEMLIEHGKLEDYGLHKRDLRAIVGLGHQTQKMKLQGLQAIQASHIAMEASTGNPVQIPAKNKLALGRALAKATGFPSDVEFYPTDQEVTTERERITADAEKANAAQMKIQEIQIKETTQNNESLRLLQEAKALEAKVKAEGAERKQKLDEESKVVDMENVKEDNETNRKLVEATVEQMKAKAENDKNKTALEIAKAEDESENTEVTHN